MILTDYRAKTLFTGWEIGEENGKMYVGVPNTKGKNIRVYYKSQKMVIKNYEGFVKWSDWLPDKTWQNNGNDYRLAYFEWKGSE
jgi:hypothetical protein